MVTETREAQSRRRYEPCGWPLPSGGPGCLILTKGSSAGELFHSVFCNPSFMETTVAFATGKLSSDRIARIAKSIPDFFFRRAKPVFTPLR
jgi:hypothetical protein